MRTTTVYAAFVMMIALASEGCGSDDVRADDDHDSGIDAGSGGSAGVGAADGGSADVGGSSGACAFSTPVLVPELSSDATDFGPWLTPDSLEVHFHSDRAGGAGKNDLWHASRASIGAPFSTPVNLASLNSASIDGSPALSPDGLTLYFHSDRPGGSGGLDVWFATRATTSDEFGAPVNLAGANSALADHGATPTSDGLALYLVSDRTTELQPEIWVAMRASLADPFGAPVLVPDLSSPGPDLAPAFSDDTRTVFLTRTANWALPVDTWTAVRPSLAEPFGAATLVAELSVDGASSRARWLSPDGLNLYLSSDRVIAGGPLGHNIFVATRPCR